MAQDNWIQDLLQLSEQTYRDKNTALWKQKGPTRAAEHRAVLAKTAERLRVGNAAKNPFKLLNRVAQLEELDPETLCSGARCWILEEQCFYLLLYNEQSPLFVYQNGDYSGPRDLRCSWYKESSEEAQDAAVEIFDATKAGGYFGSANADHAVSVVRHTLGNETQFYTAVRDMLPPNIPAPQGYDDENWRRTTRPAPSITPQVNQLIDLRLDYRTLTVSQAQNLAVNNQLQPGQHVRILRPEDEERPVFAEVLDSGHLAPEAYWQQFSGNFLRVAYSLPFDKVEPLDRGQVALLPATATRLGGVKVGPGLAVTADGTISLAPEAAPDPEPLGELTTVRVNDLDSRHAYVGGWFNVTRNGSFMAGFMEEQSMGYGHVAAGQVVKITFRQKFSGTPEETIRLLGTADYDSPFDVYDNGALVYSYGGYPGSIGPTSSGENATTLWEPDYQLSAGEHTFVLVKLPTPAGAAYDSSSDNNKRLYYDGFEAKTRAVAPAAASGGKLSIKVATTANQQDSVVPNTQWQYPFSRVLENTEGAGAVDLNGHFIVLPRDARGVVAFSSILKNAVVNGFYQIYVFRIQLNGATTLEYISLAPAYEVPGSNGVVLSMLSGSVPLSLKAGEKLGLYIYAGQNASLRGETQPSTLSFTEF
jgi:hypothetical protein